MTVTGVLIGGAIIGAIAILLVIIDKITEPAPRPYTANVKYVGRANVGYSYESMDYIATFTDKENGDTFSKPIVRFKHRFSSNEEAFIKEQCDRLWKEHKVKQGSDFTI